MSMLIDHAVRVEVARKRLRGFLGGVAVFDTTEPRLVWEVSYYPLYYVLREHVLAELTPTGRTKTSRSRGIGNLWTVSSGGQEVLEAATIYDESPIDELRGLVRFKWGALDAWFEEDEEIYAHPRSPYTRVDVLPTSRLVTVQAGGMTVAESRHAHVLFETGLPPRFYLPKTDSRMDLLTPTDTVTHSAYKGRAEYWTLTAGGQAYADAVWSYRHPLPESIRIAGLVCFDPRLVDIVVDGKPQP